MNKVILASGRAEVRKRWSEALAGFAEVQTVQGMSALAQAIDLQGDGVVLLDLALSDLNGVEQVRQLTARYPDLRIFCCSDLPGEQEGLALLAAGVCGYANTFINADGLQQALAVVASGQVWLGQRLMRALINRTGDGAQAADNAILSRLTGREREIAEVLAEGASNKIIARRLNITERTVKAHLTSIFEKTGTRDRLELALLIQGHSVRRGASTSATTA